MSKKSKNVNPSPRTLRDDIAMAVVGGMAASTFWPAYMRGVKETASGIHNGTADVAREAYRIADAMLKAREAK